MIELKGLTRKFGSFTAVENLDLLVEKGEIFGFIGPNGAGKTTTIKMMGGLMAPTSGSVSICGISMAKEPEKAKGRIGLIPDRPFLYEKLTAMEFLKFIGDLYGVLRESFYEKSEDLLLKFSLLDWKDDLIESFSHGMKQRLVMASALLHEPEVIVVDEPLVGLDPEGIKMVRELFQELAEKGRTIFMSTHTLTVAEDICSRLGVISRGRLLVTGTIDELRIKAENERADLETLFLSLTSHGNDGDSGKDKV